MALANFKPKQKDRQAGAKDKGGGPVTCNHPKSRKTAAATRPERLPFLGHSQRISASSASAEFRRKLFRRSVARPKVPRHRPQKYVVQSLNFGQFGRHSQHASLSQWMTYTTSKYPKEFIPTHTSFQLLMRHQVRQLYRRGARSLRRGVGAGRRRCRQLRLRRRGGG